MPIEEELRVCKQRVGDGDTYYDVRVVYVKDGEVVGWNEEPYTPWGETARELYREFLKMYRATNREVLDLDALEGEDAEKTVEDHRDQRGLERFDHQFERPGA